MGKSCGNKENKRDSKKSRFQLEKLVDNEISLLMRCEGKFQKKECESLTSKLQELEDKERINQNLKQEYIVVTKTRIVKDDLYDDHCSICLHKFNPRQVSIEVSCVIPHTFHNKCLKKWMNISIKCPLDNCIIKNVIGSS